MPDKTEEEIEGVDEIDLIRATEKRQGKEVEIRSHKGKRVKIKVKEIDPIEVSEGNSSL